MLRWLGLLSCVTAMGCGGAEVQRVTGTVLLDGAPLPKMCVLFWPERDVMLGVVYADETDDTGAFDVAPDQDRGEGKAGDYVVRVYDPSAGLETMMLEMMAAKGMKLPSTKRQPPKKYWNLETTPLRSRLERGINHLEPFELVGDR